MSTQPVWLNGWVFVYDLSGCGFESSCSHLNLRFRNCFEQGVPWHSGNYRMWIHSETRTLHDKNIQSKHWICWNIKTTVFFRSPAIWIADISLFHCSDINAFLIDYAWWQPCNIWLLLFENNSWGINIQI